ncbi:MAG: Flp family type IVb pilin [Abditibacteriales bacterium]|nr:Flp family type IVb pilin [Abditibacteriales bacterium]MDW8365173.1 Flp family type IVb pilin [Abditibacteriales bacterium]
MGQCLLNDEDGQTLIEYGLFLAFVAMLVVAVLTVIGGKVRDMYVSVNSRLKSTA